jgi:hypothetical protein
LPCGKFNKKTFTHIRSKIDGLYIFSSIGGKKEWTMVKNQKNLSKKDATLEKGSILI